MDGSIVLASIVYISFYVAGFCGAVAGYNAKKKGHSYAAYYFLGFFLGVIGLVVALVVREKEESRDSEIETLMYYKQLFDAGFITQDVYAFKRNEVLSYMGQMQAQPIEDEGQKRTVIWTSAIFTVLGVALFIVQLVCLGRSTGAIARYSEGMGTIRVAFFIALIMALAIIVIGCMGLYAMKEDKEANTVETLGTLSMVTSVILIVVSFITGIFSLFGYMACILNFDLTGNIITSFMLVLIFNLSVGGLVSILAFNSGLYAALYYKTIVSSYAYTEQSYMEWPQYLPVQNGAYWNCSQYQSPQTMYPRNPYGWQGER